MTFLLLKRQLEHFLYMRNYSLHIFPQKSQGCRPQQFISRFMEQQKKSYFSYTKMRALFAQATMQVKIDEKTLNLGARASLSQSMHHQPL